MRPVEAFPLDHEDPPAFLIRDPVGLATVPLAISETGLFVVGLLDGRHTLAQVQAKFLIKFGQVLPRAQLEALVNQLEAARFLDSEGFAAYYQGLAAEYRAGSTRSSRNAETFGHDEDLKDVLDRLLDGSEPGSGSPDGRRLVGLIAPHLDYDRGEPCYVPAYRRLAAAGQIERVVILGTNHFGRAPSLVATGKDFETPLGITQTDRAFLDRLQNRFGADLCEHEFDHVREHSVELQVLLLQRLFGADRFRMVPVLCPDPCRPPDDSCPDPGSDLARFGDALRSLIADDEDRTLVLAGADLSHIGWRFGDNCDLDAPFLAEVERKDRDAIGALVAGRPDLFLESIRTRGNDTRVCSAGCMYVLSRAVPLGEVELLGYHQAVDGGSGTGVSCAAMAVWDKTV